MRTINFKVSYEKLISRLPALFAYIERNEQDEVKVVKATMGKQGNYGKIVSDLYCPKNFNHTCQDGTKLSVEGDKRYSYRTLIDVYYKAKKDKEWDYFVWETKTPFAEHKTGDLLTQKEYNGLTFEQKACCQELDEKLIEDEFLQFIEKGIGLKYVGLSEEFSGEVRCGVSVKKEYPLAPDYIYLGEANVYYDKMIKMKKQIDFFKSHIKICKEDKFYYKKLKDEYELMNGDKLIEVLESLISEAEEVANEYKRYALKDGAYTLQDSDVTNKLHFNINLTTNIKDLGLVTPHIEEWVPGKRYYNGDVVYYVDENGYGMTWECQLYNGETKKPGVKEDELGRYYIDGDYDVDSELILFEDGKQKKINNENVKEYWCPQSLNWVDNNERWICERCGTVYESKNEPTKCNNCNSTQFTQKKYIGEMGDTIKVTGTCNSHLPSLRRYDDYTNRNDQPESPKYNKDWLWYYRIGTVTNIEATYDDFGNIGVMYPKPVDNNVYPQGVEHIEYENDVNTNIVFGTDNKTALNLAIWGDVLTNITAENDENSGEGKITFEYWLGVHLKAKKDDVWRSQDDDGNYKYFFKDLMADIESPYGVNHGVKYKETYIYYKSDDADSMWQLVQDESIFNKYINGYFDKDAKLNEGEHYRLHEKYEFDTSNNLYEYDIRIGHTIKNIPYNKTTYETKIDITHIDVEKTPLIRYDYYNGVTYQPSVNKDVYIERGVTQAFEKHIKFSEIKTFEDLETYSNGGFFIFSNEKIDLG